MKIFVTQEDIDKGVMGSCSFCPVALAIGRAVEVAYVSVGTESVKYGGRYRDLPRSVSAFILDFDAGRPVQPFEFEI